MSKWLPCQYCGRYASEWRKGQTATWTVTAPPDVRVEPGEKWTCSLCVRLGKPQLAERRQQEPMLPQVP